MNAVIEVATPVIVRTPLGTPSVYTPGWVFIARIGQRCRYRHHTALGVNPNPVHPLSSRRSPDSIEISRLEYNGIAVGMMFALALVLTRLLDCAEAQPATVIIPRQGAIVSMTWEEVARRALKQRSDEERRSGVVYLDKQELPAGSTLNVDNRAIPIHRRSAIVFIDRVPQAN
jgi:hypothetical protein